MLAHVDYPRAQLLGRNGEDRAAYYLLRNGYAIVDRNVRWRGGEIDIIAQDGDGTVIFVEVKTRSCALYGAPEAAVTANKMARIRSTAAHWLRTTQHQCPIRFDVIALTATGEDGVFTVQHFKGVEDGAR